MFWAPFHVAWTFNFTRFFINADLAIESAIQICTAERDGANYSSKILLCFINRTKKVNFFTTFSYVSWQFTTFSNKKPQKADICPFENQAQMFTISVFTDKRNSITFYNHEVEVVFASSKLHWTLSLAPKQGPKQSRQQYYCLKSLSVDKTVAE